MTDDRDALAERVRKAWKTWSHEDYAEWADEMGGPLWDRIQEFIIRIAQAEADRAWQAVAEKARAFISAAQRIDWGQRLNGEAPCFNIAVDGRFCGRAMLWPGHQGDAAVHLFEPLHVAVTRIALQRPQQPDKPAEQVAAPATTGMVQCGEQPTLAKPGAPPALLSDAEILERAAEIEERTESAWAVANHLRATAQTLRLRAQAQPAPDVDVFECPHCGRPVKR